MDPICTSAPGAVLKSKDARDELRAVELPEAESCRGYGPEGRHLSATDTLTLASMDLLWRDDDIGIEVARLARERPSCEILDPMVPTRHAVEHARNAVREHADCLEWMRELVTVAWRLGCPSLDAMRWQVEAKDRQVRPGAMASTRLRQDRRPRADSPASVRRPQGTIDRPARDLLARRAHEAGGVAMLRRRITEVRQAQGTKLSDLGFVLEPVRRGGWAGIELEFDQLIDAWERRRRPARLDVTYPTWREWWRSPERRGGRGRDWVRLEDSARLEADDLGQTYRKGAARIRRLLEAELPDVG
jgi:hypothetical protein